MSKREAYWGGYIDPNYFLRYSNRNSHKSFCTHYSTRKNLRLACLWHLMELDSELKEAISHFELYRLLKNEIVRQNQYIPIKYDEIIPEFPVGTGSADIVVDAMVGSNKQHFLVIEVKRPTRKGFLVFYGEGEDQVRKYASYLGALYYALTDGKVFRLFGKGGSHIGDYNFILNEENVKQLLKELSDLYSGRKEKLDFETVSSPMKEIEEISKALSDTLRNLFEELDGKNNIKLEKKGLEHVMHYLSVGSCKNFLRLAYGGDKPFIDIRTKELAQFLDSDRFKEQLNRLSEVPGFAWVRVAKMKGDYIWKNLKDIVIDEQSDVYVVRDKLRTWLLDLSKTL